MFDLKAALYTSQAQAKVDGGSSHAHASSRSARMVKKDPFAASNPGIAARNAADQRASAAESARAADALQRKSQLYDAIVAGQRSMTSAAAEHFLVDFEAKGVEVIDTDMAHTSADPANAPLPSMDGVGDGTFSGRSGQQQQHRSLYSDAMRQHDERKAWETSAMQEIESGVMAQFFPAPKPDTGVKQGYERTLSQTEKDILTQVAMETQSARQRLQQMRAKRDRELDARRLKIIAKERKKHSGYYFPGGTSQPAAAPAPS